MSEVTGTLNSWLKEQVGDITIIWGYIYGDTKGRFYDGQYIHTSFLKMPAEEVDNLKEGDILLTNNSTYKLGYPLGGSAS